MHNGGYINQTVNTTNNQTTLTKVDTWAQPPTRYAKYYQNVSLPYVSAPNLQAWLMAGMRMSMGVSVRVLLCLSLWNTPCQRVPCCGVSAFTVLRCGGGFRVMGRGWGLG